MENVSRFKGQEYCLHPKLQSTKNLVKWFRIWKDKHRYGTNGKTSGNQQCTI